MMNQISLFDGKNPFKITNKIRLIELFAGYGSQHLALKYLGANVESYKICEWAVKSIQAYKDAHFPDDNTDYSKGLSYEQIIQYLLEKGISSNYNEPMTKEQIKRMGETKCRQVYNNIKATHNLVNIQQVKGKDLEIVDTEQNTYIMTYSFPCQDLSKAGLGKGMEKGSGTRSGMLWEVERILEECVTIGNLPQVLLMENVPDVIGTNNIKHFASWLSKLESLGYHCYWKVLNGKDYGIPQNRERCFMISILGDYLYEWPQTMPLTNKLRDLLEDEVDEKYYLSDKMLAYCTDMTNRNGFVRGERFSPIDTDKKDYGYTVTTSAGQRPTDNFIIVRGKECPVVKDNENYIQWKEKGLLDSDCRAWKDDKVSGTLTTTDKQKVLERQKDVSIIQYPRGVNKGGELKTDLCPTITTSSFQTNTFIKESLKTKLCNDLISSGKVKENDVIRHSYSKSRMKDWETRGCETNNISPTLDTRCDCLGVVINSKNKRLHQLVGKTEFGEETLALDCYNQITHKNCMQTIKANVDTSNMNMVYNNLRIRKLTPKECFRLMGVRDKDFEIIAQNQSNASLYHLAGDSIIVDVLMAIFKQII